MSDTVFILGAGFSRDAGIPMLGGFVEKMWELALRGRAEQPLNDSDREILAQAMKIRDELDGYHGRAQFDDRNIEDILSILTFNVLGGTKQDQKKLGAMTHAIARTIEICCSVRHPGVEHRRGRVIKDGPDLYRNFWKALLQTQALGHSLPAIITFNYDLVLERSLFQTFIGTTYSASKQLPFNRFCIDYHTDLVPLVDYRVSYCNYDTWQDNRPGLTEGSVLEIAGPVLSDQTTRINLLKLHGSLNFPKRRARNTPDLLSWSPVHAHQDAFILPPVFNKTAGDAASSMWRSALMHLREAKNIVVVGYSLPPTDIYMQYFLKAAIGPNRNLNRVTIFDPALFSDSGAGHAMRTRYENCFSPQVRGRINFNPSIDPPSLRQGTTEAFVQFLLNRPSELLF